MAFDDPFNTGADSIDDSTRNNFYNFNDQDPAAEFLEREKRELGDITGNGDANSFDDPFNTTPTNNHLLTNGNNRFTFIQLLINWFLGAHSPVINTNGSNSPIPSNGTQYQALSELNEPEKIRKWREEFSTRIEKKDSEEEIKRKELREQAKKELDDFYKQRIEQLERTKGQNRTNNRTFEDDLFNNGIK